MANWAIVIGIDKYWTEQACLKGAVRDALKMREWLLDPQGGAVPPDLLTLLLSPAHDSPPVPADVTYLEANQGNFIQAMHDLLTESRGAGDRFFFYYAGHGLDAPMDLYQESCVAFSDISDVLTTRSLALRSILDVFTATRFRQQFFFIDACRNIPWDYPFRVGEYPRPARQPLQPSAAGAVAQYVMQATSRGLKAKEHREAGNERGAFTEVLLRALKGDPAATIRDEATGEYISAWAWDEDKREYVLRWNNLFQYVAAAVRQQRLRAGRGAAGYLIQEPRQAGERGFEDPNPILGRFPSGHFPGERLAVRLAPSIPPQTRVFVRDRADIDQERSGITQLPVEFTLPWRTYTVGAKAQGFGTRNRVVHLYGPTQVPLEWVPEATLQYEAQAGQFGQKGAGLLGQGTIVAQGADILARIELTSNAGQVIASGEGAVSRGGLRAGYYRVRLVTPEGDQVEHSLELLPGRVEVVELSAPPPPSSAVFQQVIAAADITVAEDNTIEPSEAVGPLATARLSTLLALAAGAANEDTPRGERLRRIGISSFCTLASADGRAEPRPEHRSGIQILFGIEQDDADPLQPAEQFAGRRLRCWPQGTAAPVGAPDGGIEPSQVLGTSGVAECAWACAPGAYWVALEAPGQRPIAFAVQVVKNRLALIVLHRGPAGNTMIYHYLHALLPGRLDRPDPRRGGPARFPVLQRAELIQRQYASGRPAALTKNVRDLLNAEWTEPLACVLAGHMLAKMTPGDPLLRTAAGNMIKYFAELPDSYVLQADFLASSGRDEKAAAAYCAALDRGLPVLRESLAHLVTGIERCQIEHPKADLARRVLAAGPGLSWTAVPVDALE